MDRIRMKDPRRCLRLEQVADEIGVKPRTIKAWVRDGKFPVPIKATESLVLWVTSEVDAWLDAKKAERPLPGTGKFKGRPRKAGHL